MPRVARIVLPGQPHHVTQRGNNHQDVFFVVDGPWMGTVTYYCVDGSAAVG